MGLGSPAGCAWRGVEVLEVEGPKRQNHRRRGKSIESCRSVDRGGKRIRPPPAPASSSPLVARGVLTPCATVWCGWSASPGVGTADSLGDHPTRYRFHPAPTAGEAFYARTALPTWVPAQQRSCADILAGSNESGGLADRRQLADRQLADRRGSARSRCGTPLTRCRSAAPGWWRIC